MSITYSECVSVALVIQHAKRMCRIILLSLACLSLLYLPILSHIRQDFREKFMEHKMYVLRFSTAFIRNFSYFKKKSARYHKCI
jgi:hypothetical protein